MHTETPNPLICDPETGVCEIPGPAASAGVTTVGEQTKPVKIIYFTDPICSTCWGIEPQWRKLKLEYGDHFEVEYRMGGLLPDWSYNSGGISKPSDVAHHWDEVSLRYDMPIDGDVWLEDPLDSSYPPSIAFKSAQLQDEQKAVLFLREIREMLFLQKKNIAKWEHLAAAAQAVGLDLNQFEKDYSGKGKELFDADLKLAQQLGVRGFPTIFFVDREGNQEKVYGSKPYADYENALKKQFPSVTKKTFDTDWKHLFSKYKTLTSREFAELSGTDRLDSEVYLQGLADAGDLRRLDSKNGALWLEHHTP